MEENNTNNIMLQTKGGKLFDSQCVLSVIIPTYKCRSIYKKNPYIYFGTKKLYIQNNTY